MLTSYAAGLLRSKKYASQQASKQASQPASQQASKLASKHTLHYIIYIIFIFFYGRVLRSSAPLYINDFRRKLPLAAPLRRCAPKKKIFFLKFKGLTLKVIFFFLE